MNFSEIFTWDVRAGGNGMGISVKITRIFSNFIPGFKQAVRRIRTSQESLGKWFCLCPRGRFPRSPCVCVHTHTHTRVGIFKYFLALCCFCQNPRLPTTGGKYRSENEIFSWTLSPRARFRRLIRPTKMSVAKRRATSVSHLERWCNAPQPLDAYPIFS